MLTKRTNILFEEDLWQLLTNLAARQKTSIGDLVRKAVKNVYITKAQKQASKDPYETILKIRKIHKNIDYKELINYGRH